MVILIAVILPLESNTAVAAAPAVLTPVLNISLVKVIVGLVVYPLPPDVTVTIQIPSLLTTEVPAAPLPPLPNILIIGGLVIA